MGDNIAINGTTAYINKLIEEFGESMAPAIHDSYNSSLADIGKTARIKNFIPILAYNDVRNRLHELYTPLKNIHSEEREPSPEMAVVVAPQENYGVFGKYNPIRLLKSILGFE